MKKRDKIIVGTVLGGAIGSVLGVLFAPQTGKKTRKDLNKLKTRVYDEHGDQIELVQKKSKNLAGKILKLVKNKITEKQNHNGQKDK